MQRYFLNVKDVVDNNKIVLYDQDNRHHIKNVIRMKPGEEVYLVTEKAVAFICELKQIDDEAICFSILQKEQINRELPVTVTIIQGLPKKDKPDYIVQKGTELGSHGFVFFPANRSIVKWDAKKQLQKINRLNKIAAEASEQSQRSVIPSVQYQALEDCLKTVGEKDLLLFAYEEEAKSQHYHTLSHHLQSCQPQTNIKLVIGPEGGFSEDEVDILKQNQFQPVRLGPRILRTETAALYALSSISYQFEDLKVDT